MPYRAYQAGSRFTETGRPLTILTSVPWSEPTVARPTAQHVVSVVQETDSRLLVPRTGMVPRDLVTTTPSPRALSPTSIVEPSACRYTPLSASDPLAKRSPSLLLWLLVTTAPANGRPAARPVGRPATR